MILLTRTLELASSNLDRRVHRFSLRPSSRSTSRTCKRTERRRCGRSHSNAQVSDWTTKYFKSNPQELSRNRAMFSLTVYSRTRKCKEDNLNVRTSEVRWETLIYLGTFSLLAVTHLDTWLASSRTRAIIWSLLDLGVASDSPLAKLLMHDTT